VTGHRPPGRLRGLVAPTIAAAAVFAVLIGLGTWQVERLFWKEALIAAAASRIDAPPVAAPPPPWEGFDPVGAEYTHVRLSGRYLPGEAHVYALLSDARGPLAGQGYWVMSPFETDGGWIVLVNRGFVPTDRKDPSTRPPPPAGEAVVTGVLRRPDPPGLFTPGPDPVKNVWFVRDAGVLARAFDLPDGRPLAPYTIDADAAMTPPGGVPQAGETRRVFPNSHLQYAVTWYGLAAVLVFVYAAFVAARLRGPERP
jgi:surfeit locus 1 family protein